MFEPARPRYTLPLAGEDYELLGTFGLIEAVEYAMKEYVGKVAVQVINGLPSADLARLLSAIMTSSNHPMTVTEASNLLWNVVGVGGEDYDMLRVHLYSFLSICMAPPGKREEKARKAGELMGELKGRSASPGNSTGESA